MCGTCGMGEECLGHFGHMELVQPVFNVECLKTTHRILRSVCAFCCALLNDDAQPNTQVGHRCRNCGEEQPIWRASGKKLGINSNLGTSKEYYIYPEFVERGEVITPMDVYNILRFIRHEDQIKLNCEHPHRYMWFPFIVPTHKIRPKRRRKDDHLTTRLKRILKINDKLKKLCSPEPPKANPIINLTQVINDGALADAGDYDDDEEEEEEEDVVAVAAADDDEEENDDDGEEENNDDEDENEEEEEEEEENEENENDDDDDDDEEEDEEEEKQATLANVYSTLANDEDNIEALGQYLLLCTCIGAYQTHKVKFNMYTKMTKETIRYRFQPDTKNGSSKKGRVRNTVLAKRIDYSGRMVISPCSENGAHINNVGVPLDACMILTFPERVNAYNIVQMTERVRNGPQKHPGAKYIEIGDEQIDLAYVDTNMIALEYGWIVHRHIVDGDLVLMNRQPTLHRQSIMCHRVMVNRRLQMHVIQIHVACTPPYNADFDGDAMVISVLQSHDERAEAQELMLVEKHICKEFFTPMIHFVQHTLAALYLFLQDTTILTRDMIFQIISSFKYTQPRIPTTSDEEDDDETPIRGEDVFSLFLPLELNVSFEGLEIINGIVQHGSRFNKRNLNGRGGLISCMYATMGSEYTGNFISDMYMAMETYLDVKGLSVTWHDCRLPQIPKPIETQITRGITWAEQHSTEATDDVDRSCEVLDGVRDIIAKWVESEMRTHPRNGLLEMVMSGAKGNVTNLVQISGIIGQQRNQAGTRYTPMVQYRDAYGELASSGFVRSSFVEGMHPLEAQHHLAAARVGIVDTCVKVSDTGYSQRKLAKALEDIVVNYDGTLTSEGDMVMSYLGYDAAPGEAIGVIAAQSIGEPLTQMTLNSFHYAGVFRAFTSGILRVVEIIHTSSKNSKSKRGPKTPAMIIVTRSPETPARYFYRVLFHEIVAEKTRNEFNVWVYTLKCGDPVEISEKVGADGYTATSVYSLHELSDDVVVYDSGLNVSSVAKLDTCRFISLGDDMATLLVKFRNVIDETQSYSTNILKVYQTLGVDAACELIFREFKQTMELSGVGAKDVYIRILSNWMTRDGTIRPFMYQNGIDQSKSVMKVASYERVMDTFFSAATTNATDGIDHSVTNAMVFGERVRLGTGFMDIIFPSSFCSSSSIKNEAVAVLKRRQRPPRLVYLAPNKLEDVLSSAAEHQIIAEKEFYSSRQQIETNNITTTTNTAMSVELDDDVYKNFQPTSP